MKVLFIFILVGVFFQSCQSGGGQAAEATYQPQEQERDVAVKAEQNANEVEALKLENQALKLAEEQRAEQLRVRKERKRLLDELNKVYIEMSNYSVGTFGGISDARITVQNPTSLSFSYVTVSVTYVKADGEIYKSETLMFYDVKPYSSVLLDAPGSDRGTSITAYIVSYKSPDLPSNLQVEEPPREPLE